LYRQNSFCHSQISPPHSLVRQCVAMHRRYPDARFDIWPRPSPSGEHEWRVRCLDCPNKVRKRLLSLCLPLTIMSALHSWYGYEYFRGTSQE
jgi:hypothetical protein